MEVWSILFFSKNCRRPKLEEGQTECRRNRKNEQHDLQDANKEGGISVVQIVARRWRKVELVVGVKTVVETFLGRFCSVKFIYSWINLADFVEKISGKTSSSISSHLERFQ
jgi:alanine dehydrogenase